MIFTDFNFGSGFEIPTYNIKIELNNNGQISAQQGVMMKEMTIMKFLDILGRIINIPSPIAVTMYVDKDIYDDNGNYIRTITNSTCAMNKYFENNA